MLANFGAILDIMMPTLGARNGARPIRRYMPVSPTTGAVLQVAAVEVVDAAAGIIASPTRNGSVVEQAAAWRHGQVPVGRSTGRCVWVALGVDYEIVRQGSDRTPAIPVGQDCPGVLGGHKPEGLIYDCSLTPRARKSPSPRATACRSRDWLQYGSEGKSLGYYIFPPTRRSAKQLHAGVIPKAVDDYWQFRAALPGQDIDKQLGNPVWHLLRAKRASRTVPKLPGAGRTACRSRSACCSIWSACWAPGANAARRCGHTSGNYVDNADPAAHTRRLECAGGQGALAYSRGFCCTHADQARACGRPKSRLCSRSMRALAAAEFRPPVRRICRTIVYEIGKQEEFGFENLRDWFKALYETLLGSEQGPRMGSFIALYGIAPTRQLIAEALARV